MSTGIRVFGDPILPGTSGATDSGMTQSFETAGDGSFSGVLIIAEVGYDVRDTTESSCCDSRAGAVVGRCQQCTARRARPGAICRVVGHEFDSSDVIREGVAFGDIDDVGEAAGS